MFTTCPNCKGNLLTCAIDGFSMIRCYCKTGFVDEFTLLPASDDLYELVKMDEITGFPVWFESDLERAEREEQEKTL